MTVFVLTAEADAGAAKEFGDYLKTRGHVIEVESGTRGYRHLQRGDVVAALWSQKSVFDPHRMMMEKRMLDAWADGCLVLVKLDHGFLPVGLRDLSFIDASFEQARALQGWMQAERAVRETRDKAFAVNVFSTPPQVKASPFGLEKFAEPWLGGPAMGTGASESVTPAPLPSTSASVTDFSDDDVAGSRSAPPMRAKRGAPAVLGHLLAILLLGVLAWALIAFDAPYAVEIIAVAAAATILVPILIFVLRPRHRRAAKKAAAARRSESACGGLDAMEERAPAAAPAAAPETALVFVSYAHADRAEVEPVVKVVEANGRKVWIDKGDIAAGDGWAGEIVRGIKAAKGVMVMCSAKAFESDHIKREVYLADRYGKPMLPVFLEEASPPEDFEYFFAGVQWLELFKLNEAEREGSIGCALATV